MKIGPEDFKLKKQEKLQIPIKIKKYYLKSGINVELRIREAQPKNQEYINTQEAVFVLPGWGVDVDSPVVENLLQEYAEAFGQKAFTISSRSEQYESEVKNLRIIEEESKAIAQLIIDSDKNNATIVGHSKGGIKSIDVVSYLQKHAPELSIKGLVLLGSPGLSEQKPIELVKNFSKDALVGTPKKILESNNKIQDVKNSISVVMSIFNNIGKELKRSKLNYLDRLKQELAEIGTENPNMSEIKTPIVLITGSNDLIAQQEKHISPSQEDAIRKKLVNPATSDLREHYLQENCFPNSPYVKMLSPIENGTHSLPYLRAKAVARASAALLGKYHRRIKILPETLR